MRIRDTIFVLFAGFAVVSCTASPGRTPLSPSKETTSISGSSTQWVILQPQAQAVDMFSRCLQGAQDARCFSGNVYGSELTFLNGAAALPAGTVGVWRVHADAVSPPPTVTGLAGYLDSDAHVVGLFWCLDPQTPDLVNSYVLEVGSSSGASDVGIFSFPSSSTSPAPSLFSSCQKYQWFAHTAAFGTFYLRLRAVTAAGVGPASNELVVVAPNPALPGRTEYPRASTQGATVILNWNAPLTGAPPTTYIVQASSTPGGPPNLANLATGNTATTLTASGVPAGTYYVHILAANNAGTGPPSDEFQVTVSTNCTAAPNSPSNFNWSRIQGVVTLYWSPPAGGGDVSSYLIEAGSAPGLTDSAVIDTGSVVTNLLAMIPNGGVYYVRVRAKNACGISGPSNEVIVSRPR